MPQKPRRLFLDTNQVCNLKCVQCDIHLLRDLVGSISAEKRIKLLQELANWSPKTKVLFSGGEPFLRKKELYALAHEATKLGLHASINTNGTLLKPADIEALPYSGLKAIVFSLDHHLPEVHDKIRGVPGTFERVINAIKQVSQAVHKAGTHLSVMVTAILGSHNLNSLPELFKLVKASGAEALFFQPLQPNFEGAFVRDWWKANPLWPKEPEMINRGMDRMLDLRSNGQPILHNIRGIEDMRNYFLQPALLSPGHCVSMRENLMVNMLGEVRFCFNMERLDLPPLGNVLSDSMETIWKRSRKLAKKNQACRYECGAMLCHCR